MFGGHDTHPDAPPSRVVASAPWLVVLAGVAVMVILLLVAVSGVEREDQSTGGPAQVAPLWPFAPGTVPSPPGDGGPVIDPETGGPAVPRTDTGQPSGGRTAGPPDAVPTPPATRTDPPPDPAVTGRYQLLAAYHDSFQGEVLIANSSGVARHWTVELRFPADVGTLRTFWVESAPQATLRRSGALYVFTSTDALPAQSTVSLRFHFDRSGASDAPIECRANGNACALR
jgi:hypothetical protein